MKKNPNFKTTSTIFFILLSFFAPFFAKAGSSSVVKFQSGLNDPNWSFCENKGQLKDENNKPLNDISFYGNQGGVNIYCKPGMISFVFIKTEKNCSVSKPIKQTKFSHNIETKSSKIYTERLELQLLNSNLNAEIIPTDLQPFYENYYTTGDANHGIGNVQTFKAIIYKNIYPHIDLVLNSRIKGIEYSFIVNPGGNVDDIQLQWNGLDSIKQIENGKIYSSFAFGNMTESSLYSYQQPTTQRQVINSVFSLQKTRISFKIDNYDKTQALTIDPTLSWGTYYGGSQADDGYAIVTDANNEVYITGNTLNTSGIATSGAYQTSFGGDTIYSSYSDAFVAKFNQNGSLAWATYYGGNYEEDGYGITVDSNSNAYITGITESKSGIATSGAYKTSFSGGLYDVFLAKFTPSGTLVWGTYYGANGDDYAKGITCDAKQYIYIVGSTTSTSGIATSGAYQTSISGSGGSGVFIAKFDSSGSLSWGTYYGGVDDDLGYAITNSAKNSIYITGWSFSNSGIATSGAYQTSNAGTSNHGSGEAFVAKFDSSGSLSWGTYYGGGYEFGQGVTTDANDDVYVTGYTGSISGIATSGAYQTSLKGAVNTFLAKFTSSGSLSWGTYYGGNITDYGYAITHDANNNIYTTGVTTSTKGIATSGAYQTSHRGKDEVFIAKFTSSGNLTWGSYFGENNSEGGVQGIAADANNNIYITGYTYDSTGIATSGTYKTSYANGGDVFVAKFNFSIINDAGLNFPSTQSNICAGFQNVTVQLKNFGNDTLRSDSIYWKINGVAQTPIKWTGSLGTDSTTTVSIGTYNFLTGTDTVTVWSTRPNGIADSVKSNDTAKSIISVHPLPVPNAGTNTAICNGNSASIGSSASSGFAYSWKSNPTGFNDSISNPTASPTIATTYYLTESIVATGCSKSDSVTITVNHLPSANAGINSAICLGTSTSIGATSISGDAYSWTSNPTGFNSTVSNPSVDPTVTTTYYLTESVTTTGCSKSDSVVVTINPLPDASFSQSITNTSAKFSPADSTLASYRWSFGDGNADSSAKPTHIYSSIGSYIVNLTVKNTNGCAQTDSASIVIKTISAAVNVNDTNCKYTSITFSDSSKSNGCGTINGWLWSFGDPSTSSSQNPSHTYTTAGVFTVKLVVSSSGGCTDSFSRNIFVDSTCVWPGDANDNKLVEISDVLNIGIAYGDSGARRPTVPNFLWKGQYCDNWGANFLTGANYKNADCNGDGVIDSSDLLAISINWGDSHSKTGPANSGNPANPPFYLSFSKPTYNPGDTVNASIMLGASTNSLANVYGIATEFNFNTADVDTNTLKINISKSWFGTPGKDMLSFMHTQYKTGTLFFAITRKDHKNTSGNGSIGNITFVVPQNATNNNSVSFQPVSTKLISFNETVLPLYLPSDTFSVAIATGIQNNHAIDNIKLYPNPANSTLNINAGTNMIQSVTVIDATGREVYHLESLKAQTQSISVSSFSPGIYIIKIGTENGSKAIEFMKQ